MNSIPHPLCEVEGTEGGGGGDKMRKMVEVRDESDTVQEEVVEGRRWWRR